MTVVKNIEIGGVRKAIISMISNIGNELVNGQPAILPNLDCASTSIFFLSGGEQRMLVGCKSAVDPQTASYSVFKIDQPPQPLEFESPGDFPRSLKYEGSGGDFSKVIGIESAVKIGGSDNSIAFVNGDKKITICNPVVENSLRCNIFLFRLDNNEITVNSIDYLSGQPVSMCVATGAHTNTSSSRSFFFKCDSSQAD